MSGTGPRPASPTVARTSVRGQSADPTPRRRNWTAHRWVLPVVALGGMVGASARYGLELAWPPADSTVPWVTLVTNTVGCLLIGILMVHVVEVGGAHPLLRPFLGVGVLGGFTTFSTYAVQTRLVWSQGHPVAAASYLVVTPVLALVAVSTGVFLARTGHRARTLLAHRRTQRKADR
ncbi:MAG TPA: CrcB family protein [Marmoricola sp.]|nr:CrcB family protein [Marmoricola sp.]